MSKKSKIQWTEVTWNPIMGCKKVSEGCKNCYLYRTEARWGRDASNVRRTSDNSFNAPLRRKEPKLIFTCSMSDFFIEDADEIRKEMWDIIRRTPYHTYQILTKRPERILDCLPKDWSDGWDNVWLGVSVENQEHLYRAEILADVPAKVRFISAEPLLGPLDLYSPTEGKMMEKYHWVIVGGESGYKSGKYKYRECKLEWIEELCDNAMLICSVPVFVKQTGTHLARQLGLKDQHGGDINEFPEAIQRRFWPAIEQVAR